MLPLMYKRDGVVTTSTSNSVYKVTPNTSMEDLKSIPYVPFSKDTFCAAGNDGDDYAESNEYDDGKFMGGGTASRTTTATTTATTTSTATNDTEPDTMLTDTMILGLNYRNTM
jgi:hypothetical protein